MQQLPSINKFSIINFNLEKLIFSFLNKQDQRTIYWMNKKLRNLLPDSALNINMEILKKCSSYKIGSESRGLLELSDETIACFTEEGIKLLKITNNKNIELIKTLPIPIKCYYYTSPILFENGDIIYISDMKELTFLNKDLNLIEKYKESGFIYPLCKISELSFAIGMYCGPIKIYSINPNTKKFETYMEYYFHSGDITCLLYLPKQNYLLSGSLDATINVFSLTEGKSIKKLTDHNHYINSLISLNEETFASGSDGVIKIWSIRADTSIECIRTLKAAEGSEDCMYLNLLANDFMVNRSGRDFKIWDAKTYECLICFKEDSYIYRMLVTKNHSIITATEHEEVNVWKILV
jgi:WD40 repeat protein